MTTTTVRALSEQQAACQQARELVGTNAEKLAVLHACALKHEIFEISQMTGDFAQLLIYYGFGASQERQAQSQRIADLESLVKALEFNVGEKAKLLGMPEPLVGDSPGTSVYFSDPTLSDADVDALFGDGRPVARC